MTKHPFRNLATLIAIALAAGCGKQAPVAAGGRNPDVLKVALLPDESPATVIKDNDALKQYLAKKLEKPVELVVTTDYSSMIEAVRHGRIDIAYFGPLSYCLAKSKCDIEPFAAKLQHGATTYQSVVVANAEAGLETLADIKGRQMAYGDTASTSSHLIPKSMLMAEGLSAGRDYEEVFVGNHDAVLMNVARGNAQAGGLSKPIFESLVERRFVEPEQIKVIAESKSFPQYPWAMQGDLAADLKQRIKQAFYELHDPAVLEPLKAEGFAPVEDDDYDSIRELAKLLDLDLTKPL
ncbi:MAG TPA: phosphate/phosphite/phosphonate ABC transporter substrate-binding protein [Pirellulales bacterium]|nr:phosphate/phosphite/phosphonate ABC transporter substrate-binding protein [Pirellulales bacterium]